MLRLLRTAPANDDVYKRAPDESVRKRYAELKGWLPMTLEGRRAKLRNKIEVQRSYLLDNLYSGELWAIGFRTLENGFDDLTRVPRHYFLTDYEDERDVRPNVYWAKGELIAGAELYFQIHVLRAPVKTAADGDQAKPSDKDRRAEETQDSKVAAPRDDVSVSAAPTADTLAADDRSELPVRGKPGRPSEGEVILAAIAAYRATDPKLKRPRRERYAAYKSYISSQGCDPRRDQG